MPEVGAGAFFEMGSAKKKQAGRKTSLKKAKAPSTKE
jgi:hypothetical protein